jgi:hypothetical protein
MFKAVDSHCFTAALFAPSCVMENISSVQSGEARVSLHRPPIYGLDSAGIGAQHYYRLYYKGVVQIARRVLVALMVRGL